MNFPNPVFPTNSENTISLNDLTVEDAEKLSKEILSDTIVKGDPQYAHRIAEITKDCPLATVIGSRLVGLGTIRPELLNNDRKFRDELLRSFRDVVAGDLGGNNAEEVRNLLDFLAMVQPFNPSDPQFQKSTEEILSRPYDQVLRNISMLEDSGVVLRRGNKLRVVPDLLADYLRAAASYSEKNQKPTGYADRLFEKLHGEYAPNLLMNISQLDWRLSADGVRSALLDEVWSNLRGQFKRAKLFERTAILDAIKMASYFQPQQALELVRLALEEPTDEVEADFARLPLTRKSYQVVTEKIPPILKLISYHSEYLIDALDILKNLAEQDTRRTNQYPDHPLRILQEIAAIEPGKPVPYNEAVVEHVMTWLAEPLNTNFSPFDVLDKLLETEGHQAETKGYTITLKGYLVRPEVVSGLRQSVIDKALEVIADRPINESPRVIKTLDAALSYPMGMLGGNVPASEREKWDPGILKVLGALQDVVTNTNIDPYIAAEIRRIVLWHARHGSANTKVAAKQVLDAIPQTLEYEVSRAILDIWGRTFEKDENSLRTTASSVELVAKRFST